MIFESHSHQRFQHGAPVMGLQVCNRAVEVKENTHGCSGYDLNPGDGYIVSILNLDGNHPLWGDNYQMSPKPMRILKQSSERIVLRGYAVLAMTPFGYQRIDMSDYGVTLFIEDGEVIKCRLDMFDRDVYIEYYR